MCRRLWSPDPLAAPGSGEMKTRHGWSSAPHRIANDPNCLVSEPLLLQGKNLIQLGIISDYLLSVTWPI